MRFELFDRKPLLKRRQYYFRMVASNGRTIGASEGYNNRADRMSTIALIKQDARHASIFDEGEGR